MLAMLAHSADTNLMARGGYAAQTEIQERLTRFLAQTPYPDRQTLERLDQMFTERNLSPGGSADLLALCWLLHFLREEEI